MILKGRVLFDDSCAQKYIARTGLPCTCMLVQYLESVTILLWQPMLRLKDKRCECSNLGEQEHEAEEGAEDDSDEDKTEEDRMNY